MNGGPKAESVGPDDVADGFVADVGFTSQTEPGMPTRLLVSVPAEHLERVHRDLIGACEGPIGVLYRQRIDRARPRPEGSPSRDFLALGIDKNALLAALAACRGLVYHDARGDLWLRGRRGEQVILDGDGILYAYPDDLVFRDVCAGDGLEEKPLRTLLDRDRVKQYYRAENDAEEVDFIARLGLTDITAGG